MYILNGLIISILLLTFYNDRLFFLLGCTSVNTGFQRFYLFYLLLFLLLLQVLFLVSDELPEHLFLLLALLPLDVLHVNHHLIDVVDVNHSVLLLFLLLLLEAFFDLLLKDLFVLFLLFKELGGNKGALEKLLVGAGQLLV